MYLTAVDSSWEENVPTQIPVGKRWEERSWHDLLGPLRAARVPSPVQEHAWPGHGGKFGLLLGTLTNPALALSFCPKSNGQKDR